MSEPPFIGFSTRYNVCFACRVAQSSINVVHPRNPQILVWVIGENILFLLTLWTPSGSLQGVKSFTDILDELR